MHGWQSKAMGRAILNARFGTYVLHSQHTYHASVFVSNKNLAIAEDNQRSPARVMYNFI